jgi:hypothetical protein
MLQDKLKRFVHLRWACRGIITFAAGLSIWANILHAREGIVPIVVSTWPPLLFLLGWEMVSRIPINPERAWYFRMLRPLGTVVVAGIGAWLSYHHQSSAIMRYTSDVEAARLLPIAIDGLMIIASVSVYELNERIQDTEASISGIAARPTTKPSQPKPKGKAPDKRMTLARLNARFPEASIKDLADKAGVSYNYAQSVLSKLRAETSTLEEQPA